MSLQLNHEDQVDRLRDKLRHAEAVTPDLLSTVLDGCPRIASLGRREAQRRIARLITFEAWTDAALALVELELPQWKLRRLLYEDGEWHCCLSRQPELPAWLDETVEVHHPVLPLAILSAFVEARDVMASARDVSETVPRIASDRCQAICCDNFA
jgi:hypothetical protein